MCIILMLSLTIAYFLQVLSAFRSFPHKKMPSKRKNIQVSTPDAPANVNLSKPILETTAKAPEAKSASGITAKAKAKAKAKAADGHESKPLTRAPAAPAIPTPKLTKDGKQGVLGYCSVGLMTLNDFPHFSTISILSYHISNFWHRTLRQRRCDSQLLVDTNAGRSHGHFSACCDMLMRFVVMGCGV